MSRANSRISPPSSLEPYDPKARAVGGIVLFLLMLLLYAVLKALLGISSTGAAYALRAPLPDEIKSMVAVIADTPSTPDNANTKAKYQIINKFVFLDLTGKPMEDGAGTIELSGLTTTDTDTETDTTAAAGDAAFDGADGKEWYVQVASFKEESRAQELQGKLKKDNFEAKILKVGDWYAVRLLPHETKEQANQQLRTLRKQGLVNGRGGQVRRIR